VIAKAEEPRPVPIGARDGAGDLGEAIVRVPIPGEAVLQYCDPLERSLPLANEQGARLHGPKLRQRDLAHLSAPEPIEKLHLSRTEVADFVGLDAVGQDAPQKGVRQVWRGAPKQGTPAPSQGGEIRRGEPVSSDTQVYEMRRQPDLRVVRRSGGSGPRGP
jgi:hypothetical protein